MVVYFDNRKAKKVYIDESRIGLLSEDVFASGRKGKNKVKLSYNKRKSTDTVRNIGSLNAMELINTGKMDQDNSDTYIVPLKGGITSYNITSIRGTEIMHYFKNKFAKMDLDLDGDGKKESYELFMEDDEYKAFFEQFYNKVNNVIYHVIKELYGKSRGRVRFNGVSIMPVPSSSGFNEMVTRQLSKYTTINGLPITYISKNMFDKDLSNLEKDEDFINKNKDYYSSKMFTNSSDNSSHENYVDNAVDRFSKIDNAKEYIDAYNEAYRRLNICYTTNRVRYGERFGEALARFYKDLWDRLVDLDNSIKGIHRTKVYSVLKGTKSQVEARKTEDIWRIVKPYLRGTGVRKIQMHEIQPQDFQIKNLSNDTRMGLKNFFSSNADVVESEIEKIKGTIFVIFDDNISGGATLSDICLQARNIGIKYIIPITFGEMQEKYNLGSGFQVNRPSKPWNF